MFPDLSSIWQSTVIKFTPEQDRIDQYWTEIEEAYCSKGRYYHTLQHLREMFQLLTQYQKELVDPDALNFAIFYHDIIYNPTRKNNEERSAKLASDRLRSLGLSEDRIRHVHSMIEATKGHSKSSNRNTNFLLDFDLVILGGSLKAFEEYTRQIRKEYAIFPDLLYQPGRRKVLKALLQQEHIYKIPAIRAYYEKQARENIQ